MIEKRTLVDDALLKELSAETRKIGSKVFVKRTPEHPAFSTEIIDVIIMPHTSFYRAKFMDYYLLYSRNSVKALKELANHFPFIPDYQLGIAYVLNIEPLAETKTPVAPIKISSELEFRSETVQQEISAKALL